MSFVAGEKNGYVHHLMTMNAVNFSGKKKIT